MRNTIMTRDKWSEEHVIAQIYHNIMSESSIEKWVEDVCQMEKDGRFKHTVDGIDDSQDYYRADDLRTAMQLATRFMQLYEFSKTHSDLIPSQEELAEFARKIRRDESEDDSRWWD